MVVKVEAEVESVVTELEKQQPEGNVYAGYVAPGSAGAFEVEVRAYDEEGNVSAKSFRYASEEGTGWITPKTDWKRTDRFNAVDYNRIKNNLQVLAGWVNDIYCPLVLEGMGEDKSVESWFFAREFNVMEQNLERINQTAFLKDIGDRKTFFDNAPFIDYIELNRIEGAMLAFMVQGQAHKKTLPRLALRLGGTKGVKV